MLRTNHPMGPPGLQPAHAASVRGAPNARSNKAAIFLLIALAAYAFARVEHEPLRDGHVRSVSASRSTPLAAPFTRPIDLDATCDGRSSCAQMTSCSEAKAFLRSCPDAQPIDRDSNGIPCEKTWCNSPLAN